MIFRQTNGHTSPATATRRRLNGRLGHETRHPLGRVYRRDERRPTVNCPGRLASLPAGGPRADLLSFALIVHQSSFPVRLIVPWLVSTSLAPTCHRGRGIGLGG